MTHTTMTARELQWSDSRVSDSFPIERQAAPWPAGYTSLKGKSGRFIMDQPSSCRSRGCKQLCAPTDTYSLVNAAFTLDGCHGGHLTGRFRPLRYPHSYTPNVRCLPFISNVRCTSLIPFTFIIYSCNQRLTLGPSVASLTRKFPTTAFDHYTKLYQNNPGSAPVSVRLQISLFHPLSVPPTLESIAHTSTTGPGTYLNTSPVSHSAVFPGNTVRLRDLTHMHKYIEVCPHVLFDDCCNNCI